MSTNKRKPDDPAQSKRFIDMAREIEADESSGTFERAFKHITGRRDEPPKQAAIPSRRIEKPTSS